MSLFEDIKAALADQPYQTKCAECGSDVEVGSADVDSGLDLTISIVPCPKCIESAVAEAVEEAKEE